MDENEIQDNDVWYNDDSAFDELFAELHNDTYEDYEPNPYDGTYSEE